MPVVKDLTPHCETQSESVSLADPSRLQSTRVSMMPVLFAIGAAAAAHTAFLSWLPSLVDAGRVGQESGDHDVHVPLLSAIFPLGGMLTAPLWGWLSDRCNFRALLILAVATLAIATALSGSTSLTFLYLLRLLAGVSFGAIVPLCLLVGKQAATGDADKARIFTILTASLFLGDFAGPLLAGASARLSPQMPLFSFGLGVGGVALALTFVRTPSHFWQVKQLSGSSTRNSNGFVLVLLGLTITGTAGLSAVHLSMALHRPAALLGREQIALMLSLCGLAMLGAQAIQAKTGWLVTRPATLAAAILILLGVALWLFTIAGSGLATAVAVFAAGWSAATLRLIGSFWISAPRDHSGVRLGVQHAVASVGQVAVPSATALLPIQWHPGVAWVIILACILLLFAVPLAWGRTERQT